MTEENTRTADEWKRFADGYHTAIRDDDAGGQAQGLTGADPHFEEGYAFWFAVGRYNREHARQTWN